MTILQHLDALVVMEKTYREKATEGHYLSDAVLLAAEFCAWHREILESNCGEFLDREISGSQAAELSHRILDKERVETILGL